MDEHLLACNEPHPAILLPARHVQNLERNQKLNLCCRHVEEEGHTAQWFATPAAQKEHNIRGGEIVPDVLIIICGKCRRKHRILHAGSSDNRVIIKETR